MRNTIRVSMLASVIGVGLCGMGWTPAMAQSAAGSEVSALKSYIVEFSEDGLFYSAAGLRQRKGGTPVAAQTFVDSGKLDVHAADSVAYLNQLALQQAMHIAAMRAAIGREHLNISHYYNITLSGISLELTEAEAAIVAGVPGVKSIELTPYYERQTFRGPTFIGANQIWSGAAIPRGVGTRGEGQVLASLDGGTNSTHPSFADDVSCGFNISNHKLKSALDCTNATTPTGACDGPNPEDIENGHGIHTASTAAGNVVTTSQVPAPPLVAPYTQISGVAPCAAVRAYKMCDSTACGGNATLAAVNNLIAAGDVTAINYSVGPTAGGTAATNPWALGQDKEFLPAVQAGILVATSAGNTSATLTTPGGRVSHQAPWMMTVGASTQDEIMSGGIHATGPGTPPANTQGIFLVPGSTTPVLAAPLSAEILNYPTNIEGCTAAVAPSASPDSGTPGGGFPAGYFAGKIALIQRGDCTFSVKIDNAYTAGAIAVVIYNNLINFGTVTMDMAAVTTPGARAYFIEGPSGLGFKSFIAATTPAAVSATMDPVALGLRQGDVLGSFSLRGPTAGVTEITKPDITGPGADILAAKNAANGQYGLMSGTSMSGPHLAGAGMLVRAAHPDWTPAEIKSALMLTAKSGFRENGTTPWNPDDVGNGRVDLSQAAKVGFVLDITDYFAANTTKPAVADQRAFNLASMRNTACSKATACSWTRTVRDVLSRGTDWTVSVTSPSADIPITVSPTTFSLNPGSLFRDGFDGRSGSDTQVLTITATPGPAAPVSTTTVWFGDVVFTESSGAAPPVHMSVALKVAN